MVYAYILDSPESFPELNQLQVTKLRHLTIIELAALSKVAFFVDFAELITTCYVLVIELYFIVILIGSCLKQLQK